MKKSVGILSGLAIAIAVATTAGAWYTGKQLPAELDNALVRSNAELKKALVSTGGSMSIERVSLEQHFFSSTAQYRLKALKRRCDAVWQDVDLILTPTAGYHPTIAAVEADPIRINTDLGYYANFMNLLDYSAVAVPAAIRPDGLPFGITLFAPAHQDLPLLELADRW